MAEASLRGAEAANRPYLRDGAQRRKDSIRRTAERVAGEWDAWRRRNAYFHAQDLRYMRFLVPPGQSVLELGCAAGSLLAGLEPGRGVGVDISAAMVEIARRRHPHLDFHVADIEDPGFVARLGAPFDVIVLSDTIGYLEDIQATFAGLHALCTPDTRIVVAHHSGLWEPVIRAAERLGLKSPTVLQNWLSAADIGAILDLADFETVKTEWRMLCPKRLAGLGDLVNRFVAPLPLVRRLCVRNYVVLRSRQVVPAPPRSASVVIPCRNEEGNIEAAVRRIPRFAEDLEIVFVEGHSRDGTAAEIERVIACHPELDIKVLVQDGVGKGDAVRKGFDAARGDVVMILDADLTTPPEDLPKFFAAIASGKGEFVNGSRLVYPMERQAMRFLNLVANNVFSLLFSWLLNQRITDTLCGTKALRRRHYAAIRRNRGYFGDFDPFGDFDLIFGAAKQNLKIVEVPIRYAARTYGETQISRFRHGLLLLRMVWFAFLKLKAF
jgi:SAM-dependent methyltransferase